MHTSYSLWVYSEKCINNLVLVNKFYPCHECFVLKIITFELYSLKNVYNHKFMFGNDVTIVYRMHGNARYAIRKLFPP